MTVDLLDRGLSHDGRASGPLHDVAEQFMYFETGQGSEFTYGKHHGIDMTTTEALCYGLARRYDPFMVNNVTGFIGPETHVDNFEMIVANLQDHFMGKLLGLPMGMAPCYTLHSSITLDGQQMATQLLTAAGANYYMDVCLNTDRMLAYFDTSAHDSQTLREVRDLSQRPEFLEWAIERGIYRPATTATSSRGPNWGNARQFCDSDAEFEDAGRSHAGRLWLRNGRPAAGQRRQPASAVAPGSRPRGDRVGIAAWSELRRLVPFRVIATEAADKQAHLNSPSAGSRVAAASVEQLTAEQDGVQNPGLRRFERRGDPSQPARRDADAAGRTGVPGIQSLADRFWRATAA